MPSSKIRKRQFLSECFVIGFVFMCISGSSWAQVEVNSPQQIMLKQEILLYSDPQTLARSFQTILNEKDPNQQIKLISDWQETDSREVIAKEKQPYLWATLHLLKAGAFERLESNRKADNLEWAIIHSQQALQVFRTFNYFVREETLIESNLSYLHLARFRIAQEEMGKVDGLKQQWEEDQSELRERNQIAFENYLKASADNITMLVSRFNADSESFIKESEYSRSLENALDQEFAKLNELSTTSPYQDKEVITQINQQMKEIMDSVEGLDEEDIQEVNNLFSQENMITNTYSSEMMQAAKREIVSSGTIELELREAVNRNHEEFMNREPEPELSHNPENGVAPELAIFTYLIMREGRNRQIASILLDIALKGNEAHFQALNITPLNRLQVVEQARDLFNTAIWSSLQKEGYTHALDLLERSKARFLRENLATDEINLSNMPAEQREKIQLLRNDISELEIKLRDKTKEMAEEAKRALRKELIQKKKETRELHDSTQSILSGEDIRQLLANMPPSSAIIAPVFTDTNTIVFVIPAGTKEIKKSNILILPEFSRRSLRTIVRGGTENQWASAIESYWEWANETNVAIRQEKKLAWQNQLNSKDDRWGGYIQAYRDWTGEKNEEARKSKKANWQNQLNIGLDKISSKLVNPVMTYLRTELGFQSVPHLFWLSDDDSSVLPVHAAIVEGRLPMLAQTTVQFVPSLASLDTAQKHARNNNTQHLLALVNPTEDLEFAPVEGGLVSRYFSDYSILQGTDGSIERFIQALAERPAYLHLAAHGIFQWDNPHGSGIDLAEGKRLSLGDLLSKPNLLTGSRLAVLSACETGHTDPSIPSEALGLPTAFLQTGVPGVISTLWNVNDASTTLLMDKFYKLHRKHTIDPPQALAKAQEWLRTTTNREFRKLLNDYMSETSPHRDQMMKLLEYIRIGGADEKPFQEPYYWAGYMYSGI